MSKTGNRGEWSELYTLFKLLSHGVLDSGDADLNKIADSIYPIVKIIREESGKEFTYSFTANKDIVIVSTDKIELVRISVKEFADQAQKLLKQIKASSGSSFEALETEDFMAKISCLSIKAESSAKKDITIQIHDAKTSQDPILGFSIKSQLGNASTLLNAGKTTNFIYEVSPRISTEDIQQINKIDTRSKIKDRLDYLYSHRIKLKFVNLHSQMFHNNLTLIDSLLPEILSQVVRQFYSSKMSSLNELVTWLEQNNPLGFDNSGGHEFYTVKIKRFLTDVALGMMPSKCWTGQYEASGGYLIVKDDGDIICYHLYDRNLFEDYLLNNTKLETASSSRHQFGSVYIDNGQKMNLNLQIRFTK